MTDARTSREAIEALISVAPATRVTREAIEALISMDPDARISRETVEILYQSLSPARITREAVEVLYQSQATINMVRETTEVLWQYQSPFDIAAERVEVLHTVDPDAYISGESVEILYQEQSPATIAREVVEILYIAEVIDEIFEGVVWTPIPLETGIEKGVLYSNGSAVPWNGLISVEEKSPGGELATYFYDGVGYRVDSSVEDFALSIEAYTYPELFSAHADFAIGAIPGTPRYPFDLSYVQENKIHLVWNCMTASPSRKFKTRQAQDDISAFMWEIVTRPEPIPGAKPSSHMVIDLDVVDSDSASELQTLLYDSSTSLPSPEEILAIFAP